MSGEAAIEHLREAHALAASPVRRAEAARLLGGQLFVLRGEEADAVLQEALDELAGADPELERFLAAGLITNGLFAPALHRNAAQRLERVRVEPPSGTAGEKLLLSVLAYHDARAGRPAAEVVPLARKALADGTILRGRCLPEAYVATSTVLAMADLDEVLTVYEDALAEAHRRGSTLRIRCGEGLPRLALRWRGDLGEVEAEAREALAAGRGLGRDGALRRHAAAFLADSLMEQGRLDEAAAALAGAWPGELLPAARACSSSATAPGACACCAATWPAASRRCSRPDACFEAVGSRNPAFIAWRSPAALALLRLGERDEAGRWHGKRSSSRAPGVPRGRLAPPSAQPVWSRAASAGSLCSRKRWRCWAGPGEARAREGAHGAGGGAAPRPTAARSARSASTCGRAGDDLRRHGARSARRARAPRHRRPSAPHRPERRRVADAKRAPRRRDGGRGPTNREIAQALFVTQRTVEVHLTSIYRKLAISSRSQLAAALADPART